MKLNLPSSIDALSLSIEKPFYIFEWTDLLPVETYRQLLAEFPGKDSNAYRTQNVGKLYINDRQDEFHQILRSSQVWADFYNAWKVQSVIDRLQALVRPHIQHRSAVEKRRWTLVKSTNRHPSNARERIQKTFFEKVMRRKTVRLGFEFSILPDNASVPPHTDSIRKLVSLVYYFPDDDWQKDYGGGTCFYRIKPEMAPWNTWRSYYLQEQHVQEFRQHHDLIVETPFLPNRVCGFVKTDQSWHEVKPLNLPEGKLRRSLCINIFTW